MATNFLAAAVLAMIFAPTARACEGPQNLPGRYIDVHFESDSSEIPRTELARLSVWSSDIRNRFPIIDVVWLVGLSESTEQNAQQLAYRRAENVMNALDQFTIKGTRSAFIGRVYPPVPGIDQSGRRVEVNVGPGCPDHGCPNLSNTPAGR
ncbi:hypothetical protein B7G54_34630 [Burkholderia puraquae]|uniref:OmpA-like domain-containing protein n=1 Tax=Burkholderia puraquae TaxID=1904757 RepID=A0A1X1P797_9BURK|nr:OmpA family protein [Burkholderia puraquae]ORT80395.1 hypothetical protein B7G54_34630 [Burkholderia puraquae]